jgi:hypothetical protein
MKESSYKTNLPERFDCSSFLREQTNPPYTSVANHLALLNISMAMKVIALNTMLFMLLIPVPLVGVLPVWLMQADPALFSFGILRWLAIPLGCRCGGHDLVRLGLHCARARHSFSNRSSQGTGRQRVIPPCSQHDLPECRSRFLGI